MKNALIKNTVVLLFLINWGLTIQGQTIIDIVEGKGVLLTCKIKDMDIQWQRSSDNTTWIDIANATKDSMIVTPNVNTYYRAKIGTGNCISISDVYFIKVQRRPNEISDFSYSFTKQITLKNCTYVSTGKYYTVRCETSYHYTLRWDKGNSAGVLITTDPYFLPKDGTVYSTSTSSIKYYGTSNSWYANDIFGYTAAAGNERMVEIYTFTYDTDFIYSIGEKKTIYINGNYNLLHVEKTCNCND